MTNLRPIMHSSCFLLSIISAFFLISNCSTKKEVSEVANNFFSLIDQRDYKTAYQLLSQIDKQIMDADSFHVFCYRQEGLRNQDVFEIYSIITEDFQAVSTIVEPNQKGTFVVTQVLRIPDFQLMWKTMGKGQAKSFEEVLEFLEFFKRIKSQGTIPTKLDSSRTIKVTNENGQFVVSVGLSKYSNFFDSAYNNHKNLLAMKKSGFEPFHFFKLTAEILEKTFN